jgi:arylsulfatase A-like enzyme
VTAVIYTSDNGFFLGEHGLYDKRLMYEPSIRVPMLVRYPPGFKLGTVESRMVLNVDVAHAVLQLARLHIPSDMQGQSWVALPGQPRAPWRNAFLYEYYEYPAVHCARKHRGVRTDRWKLIHYWEQPQEWELYDLEKDPDEIQNLAYRPDYKEKLSELKRRMVDLRSDLKDFDRPGSASVAAPCHQGG